jgi:hypothetical protein
MLRINLGATYDSVVSVGLRCLSDVLMRILLIQSKKNELFLGIKQDVSWRIRIAVLIFSRLKPALCRERTSSAVDTEPTLEARSALVATFNEAI